MWAEKELGIYAENINDIRSYLLTLPRNHQVVMGVDVNDRLGNHEFQESFGHLVGPCVEYNAGAKFFWHNFNSTSTKKEAAESFLGDPSDPKNLCLSNSLLAEDWYAFL